MSLFTLEIRVTPRPGILDPEGQAIHHALHSLGYGGAASVRVGKAIQLELEAPTEREALGLADEMCRKLLANPVTEDYHVELAGGVAAGAGGAA